MFTVAVYMFVMVVHDNSPVEAGSDPAILLNLLFYHGKAFAANETFPFQNLQGNIFRLHLTLAQKGL